MTYLTHLSYPAVMGVIVTVSVLAAGVTGRRARRDTARRQP